MSFWLNILEGALLLAAGAALCYLLLWWKDRSIKRAGAMEADAMLTKARSEVEVILRDARLSAAEDARNLREETEKSFASRRTERAELEKRLSQREVLLNSQLERIVEAEKTLTEQKGAFRQRSEALDQKERDVEGVVRQARAELEKAAHLTTEEAKAEFLKRVEQEAMQEANHLARHILEDAKTRAEEKARRIITVAIQRYAGEHTFEKTTATRFPTN